MNGWQNHFQKPPVVKFRFIQNKRFYTAGEVQDQDGRVLYRLVDTGKDHVLGFIKPYPLEIYRAHDNSFVAMIDWKKSPKRSTVKGLNREGPILVKGGLMNEDLVWKMPDGSKFEWDGIWGHEFVRRQLRLFDYRIAQQFSIVPAIVASHKPRALTGEPTTLEVLRDALVVPHFLDYLVITSLWMEYMVYDIRTKDKVEAMPETVLTVVGS